MNIIFHRLFCHIFMLLSIASCASKANITIPAYQKFVLGEYETNGFSVALNNTSAYEVKVETRDSENKRTSGFGLDAKVKTKVFVPKGEKAVLINSNPKKVVINAKLTQSVEGMRYEVIDMKKMENTQTLNDVDLEPLISDKWEGALTYMDYSSGEKVEIPCNLKVKKVKENVYQVSYVYPDEPQANGTNEVKITDKGKKLEDREVIRAKQEGEYFVIKTVAKGKDNDKEATLYYTYRFNDKELSIKKEVQTIGSDEMKFRNEYKFKQQ